MTTLRQQSDTPDITALQMDAGGIGDVHKSVNLFRGDVNLPVKLLSLPGPNGLSVGVTAFYQSNVQHEVETWNLEAPTSVLGVGWSLPYDQIILANPENALKYGNQYYVSSGGTVRRLDYDGDGAGKYKGRYRYKTEPYQFWRIHYNPDAETWEIANEDGVVYVYGGLEAGDNAIQWGVKWGAKGSQSWYGSSQELNGQYRFALAWNLHTIRDLWGNTITYRYLADEIPVCAKGKTYTRASYLSQITDVYGRTVAFNYEPKVYTAQQQEYQDPHKYLAPSAASPPAHLDEPNGFQDRYETKYLDSLQVDNSDGQPLLAVQLGYDVCNVSSEASEPGLFKRYLKGIVQKNRFGDSLPGLKFDYYSDNTDVQPGALRSVTSPTGGTCSYTYERANLTSSDRHLSIPVPLGSKARTPRVWFGPDYAVVALHDGASLAVSACTWAGRWRQESLGSWPCSAQAFKTLQVTMRPDLFALYWNSSSYVRTFRREKYSYGDWSPENITLTAAAGSSNVPPVLVSGRDFFLLYDAGLSGPKIKGWYRDGQGQWPGLQGHLPSVTDGSQVSLAARDNTFVVYTASGTKNVYCGCFDDRGNPSHSALTVSFGTILPSAGYPTFWWSLSESFAVATYLSSQASGSLTYEIKVLKWSAAGDALSDLTPTTHRFTLPVNAGHPLPFVAQIYDNSLILTGGDVFRYTGRSTRTDASWNHYTLPALNSSGAFDFGIGENSVAMANSSQAGSACLPLFSPGAAPQPWRTPLLAPSAKTATLSGRYATADNRVLYRRPSAQWPTGDWQSAGSLASSQRDLRNLAPAYLLSSTATGSATDTKIAFFRNGNLRPASSMQTLAGQRYLVDPSTLSTGPGTGVVWQAGSMFATWDGKSFATVRNLHLYWVVEQSAVGPLKDLRVSKVEIDDGYPTKGLGQQQHSTELGYDGDTAGVSPAGNVTQYSKVVTMPGGKTKPVGCTEHYFLNGLPHDASSLILSPQTYDSFAKLVNGTPIFSVSFDAAANIVAASTGVFEKILLAGSTRDFYIRPTRQTTLSSFVNLFTASTSTSPGDSELLALLKDLGQGASICARATGNWWMVSDPVNHRAYILKQTVPGTVKAYAGLAQTAVTTYNRYGLPAGTSTGHYNAAGKYEKVVRSVTYACDGSPYWSAPAGGMQAVNRLNAVIGEKVETIRTDDRTPVAATAVTWKDWSADQSGRWAPVQTFVAETGAAATTGFDFKATDHPDWLKTEEVTSRTARGTASESVDVDGVYSCAVYDDKDRPVAAFTDAALNEVSFWGCEDGEHNSGWNSDPDLRFIGDVSHPDAFAMGKCLWLEPQAYVQITMKVPYRPERTKYVLSHQVMADKEGDQVQWQVALDEDWADGHFLSVTSGMPVDKEWRYFYLPFDLANLGNAARSRTPGQIVTIVAVIKNLSTSNSAFVDDLRLSPLTAGFESTIYDPYDGSVAARSGANGESVRYLYDDFRRPIAAIDASGNLQTLPLAYNSPQRNGSYLASDPSSVLTVSARGATNAGRGFAYWQRLWTGDGTWSTIQDGLRYAGSTRSEIAFQGSTTLRSFALYFRFGGPLPAFSQPFEVGLGKVRLGWNPGGASWELTKDDGQTQLASTKGVLARAWLIVVLENTLMFYGDGRQVLAHAFDVDSLPDACVGTISISASDHGASDHIDLLDVLVFEDPGVGIAFFDGAGRMRQAQALELAPASEGATPTLNILAAETLYDDLGRRVLATRPVRYAQTLPGYKSALVTTYDPVSGKITAGDVLTQYPDDAGYPFTRVRYDDSPLSRIVEQGGPGTDLAIPATGTGHTLRNSSGVNVAGDWTGLPAGQYRIDMATNRDGVQVQTVTNAAGQAVATSSAFQGTKYTYDAAGRPLSTQLPNGAACKNTSRYDFLGREIEVATVDSGTTRYLYGRSGRIRFVQDAEGTARGYVQYSTYDRLGRPLEDGTVPCVWASLTQANADDDGYVPAGTRTVSRSYVYDTPAGQPLKPDLTAFGGAPYRLGRLCSVTTRAGADTVTETFGYDLLGATVDKTLQISGDAAAYTTRYAYDNLGNVTQVTYPAVGGDPALEIYYRYDALGRLVGVGDSTSDPEGLAAFAYDAQGRLATEALASKALKRTYRYNSPGWIQKIDDDFLTADFTYFTGSYGDESKGSYTGDLASRSYTFKAQPSPRETPTSYVYRYKNDPLGRMLVADDNDGAQSDVGVGAAITYDDNGNIQSLQRGSRTLACRFAANTNRLLDTDGGVNGSYQYDANGHVTATPVRTVNGTPYGALTLAYDPFTGMTRSLEVGQKTRVELLYDSRNRRIRKKTTDKSTSATTSRLYLHGLHALPLVEVEGTVSTWYIYGPNGLVAVRRGGVWYFVLKDHEGSIQRVVDGAKNVQASYDYLPFGNRLRATNPTFLNYQYTGQEYDGETGLHNYRARLYDSDLGRFYAVDPAGQFASPYLYAGDDPLRFTDPTGLFTWNWSAAGAAAASLGMIAAGIFVPGAAGAGLGAGVSGLIYSVKSMTDEHGEFTWENWGRSTGAGAIGGLEVQLGVGLSIENPNPVDQVVGGALIGAGMSGIAYAGFHGNDSDFWEGYKNAQVEGAAAGAITGLAGLGGVALAGKAASPVLKALIFTAAGAAGGAGANAADQGIGNYQGSQHGFSWKSFGVGAAVGAVAGGAMGGAALRSAWKGRQAVNQITRLGGYEAESSGSSTTLTRFRTRCATQETQPLVPNGASGRLAVPALKSSEARPPVTTTMNQVTVFTGNRFPLVAVTVFNSKKFMWFLP